MRLKFVLVTLAVGFASVQASFKHHQGGFFDELADLTRTGRQQAGATINWRLNSEGVPVRTTGSHDEHDSQASHMRQMAERKLQEMQAAQLDSSQPQVRLLEGQDTPSSFYPLKPPSIPLAVRSPCM